MRMVGVKVISGKGYLERRLMAVEGHLERAYHRWIERRGAGITRNNKQITRGLMCITGTFAAVGGAICPLSSETD